MSTVCDFYRVSPRLCSIYIIHLGLLRLTIGCQIFYNVSVIVFDHCFGSSRISIWEGKDDLKNNKHANILSKNFTFNHNIKCSLLPPFKNNKNINSINYFCKNCYLYLYLFMSNRILSNLIYIRFLEAYWASHVISFLRWHEE